ncbi:hypothetical protein [Chryseobacterium camelliae]|uniref:hypothetical protein n=1 Tax=Chryseobacterium camelliae TaxID=1265445 RepID=UPI000C1CB245|nr:hypothetical protein [Chryseobacterium camelliae]MDR6514214.1 hypothetical protein [Chryseobacterium camelliae]
MKKLLCTATVLISGLCFCQSTETEIKAAFFDGTIVAGYADHGAFINCTGPNISLKNKSFKLMLGMLPSLRIKEDRAEGTRNSLIMPALGAGMTAVYKRLAVQLPVYYNAKTPSQNGSWKAGIGLGYSFR